MVRFITNYCGLNQSGTFYYLQKKNTELCLELSAQIQNNRGLADELICNCSRDGYIQLHGQYISMSLFGYTLADVELD